jgi:hypothetical protein
MNTQGRLQHGGAEKNKSKAVSKRLAIEWSPAKRDV